MKAPDGLLTKLASFWSLLDERACRLMAASEVRAFGHGGISDVMRACRVSRKAITNGIQEIEAGTALLRGRIQRPGAGRKKTTHHDPRMVAALNRLIGPDTRGDPESPLRWTCKVTGP